MRGKKNGQDDFEGYELGGYSIDNIFCESMP